MRFSCTEDEILRNASRLDMASDACKKAWFPGLLSIIWCIPCEPITKLIAALSWSCCSHSSSSTLERLAVGMRIIAEPPGAVLQTIRGFNRRIDGSVSSERQVSLPLFCTSQQTLEVNANTRMLTLPGCCFMIHPTPRTDEVRTADWPDTLEPLPWQ